MSAGVSLTNSYGEGGGREIERWEISKERGGVEVGPTGTNPAGRR